MDEDLEDRRYSGDGIGPEVIDEALKVLDAVERLIARANWS